eukprot:CAMPEP_0113626390 /NCGR_PEP_ID=MMETSP0017_2-20120614/13646_1 /TAXON_ID=2856 /ORGANISM="Cylindrotheca closterium" /LENGTH=257 /DNA_ID=CAMNT_0000536565 /DNA_START=386 /DNA_END=1159 /DNA_ORIENTATION=+ /assembly_acc=CAM_ASM_000147
MARFRDKTNVVVMEIGVQSGGKIPLLRKYFGPGLVYVGIDINPSTKMFETRPDDDFTVHIEIGNSADPKFLAKLRDTYPHVDIFLDDGGHTMKQQIISLQYMLPHVQPEGIYICEDLATSWHHKFGGIPKEYVGGNPQFVKKTMVGMIHQTMDWLMAGAMHGESLVRRDSVEKIDSSRFTDEQFFDTSWWQIIPSQVKHIHYYNQLVVYEKGLTYKATPLRTVGTSIPTKYSGEYHSINWKGIIQKLDNIFGETKLL